MAIQGDYLDTYMTPCASFGWQGGPEFKTRIVEMRNGRERRNAEIENARHRFSVPFANISSEDYASIKQLHLVCKGMLRSFKFRDELDYSASAELFGVGDGVTTVFQLSKISTLDGVSYSRGVYVLENAPAITVGASPAGTHVVDLDRGLVTFAAAPGGGAALRWSGEFALWVRFNQDDLPFSIDNERTRRSGQVDLIEVPPPSELTS